MTNKILSHAAAAAVIACSGGPLRAEQSETEYLDSIADLNFGLDEVVVTGVRSPKLLKNSPIQTRLISAAEISRSDATDIEDLMRQEIPGVEFSYAMNQQVHLNFNGQGGQSVLFLVDGEYLAGETMDDVDFSRLNLSNVDHIEIVKGASSALYGSNAGGGVINIITRKAVNPWRIYADARIGRHCEQRYNLSVTAKGSHISNIFSGERYSIHNFDVESAPDPATRVFTTVYGSRIWNFSDQLTYTPVNGLTVSARGGYFFRQTARIPDSPERYRDFSGGLRAEWEISGHNHLEISYAFDQYDKSDFRRINGIDIRNYSNVQHSVRTLFTHTFASAGILSAGADLKRDYMMNTKLSSPTRHQISADGFAQYDWMICDKWEIVGALRYDYFSDGGMSRLTPKISGCYRPLHSLSLRAGYGMGFRAPTLKEKYYQFDMAGIWIVNGNPELKPESSHNLTFSADYTHGSYNITVSGYFNSIHNKIANGLPYCRPGDDSQLYLDYVNLDRYSVAGGEVAVQGRWANGLYARINYAYTHEHLAHDKNGNTVNNQYIPARRHSMTARIDWEHPFSKSYTLCASVSGRALSGVTNVEYRDYYDISKGTVEIHYPPYTLWKFMLSQSFGKYIRLTLSVDNIFNYKPRYYYLNSPLTDGASLSAGLSVDFY